MYADSPEGAWGQGSNDPFQERQWVPATLQVFPWSDATLKILFLSAGAKTLFGTIDCRDKSSFTMINAPGGFDTIFIA